jgi:hypothetical protein
LLKRENRRSNHAFARQRADERERSNAQSRACPYALSNEIVAPSSMPTQTANPKKERKRTTSNKKLAHLRVNASLTIKEKLKSQNSISFKL